MAFISVVKVYETVVCLFFDFLEILGLIYIEQGRELSYVVFSYSYISRANAYTKP